MGRLLKSNFRITLNDAIIYRSHTVFFILFETIFFIANFYTVHIGFDIAGGTINGWTKQEGFLVASIFNFTHQIFLTFFSSFVFDIGEKSGNGTLDFILLKPQRPLITLWVCTCWTLQNIPSTILSGCVLVYLMSTSLNTNITLLTLLTCLSFIILGVLVRLALALLCVSPVFFSEKLHAVDTYWSLASVGVYPQAVLPKIMQHLFTFGLPVFLISSIPAEAFFGMRSGLFLVSSFAVGIVFSIACFRIFSWSLGHYKSVNAGV